MDDRRIDALKGALLLEKRAEAHYRAAAERADNAELRGLFAQLADDEVRHQQALNKAFRALLAGQPLEAPPTAAQETADSVLTKEVTADISAAGYEASVVFAALALEERAVAYYTQKAQDAADASERELYEWLAGWERSHAELLMALEEDLRQRVWHDQHFWPLL